MFRVLPPVRVSLSCNGHGDVSICRCIKRRAARLELLLAGNVNVEEVHLAVLDNEIACVRKRSAMSL